MKKFFPYFLIILLGVITYLPSFTGQLYWDDEDFITKNEYVKQFRIDKFFTAQAVEGSGKISNYFRPLQFSLYAIIYKLFGPSAIAFHTLSIVTHIAAAMAVYLFFIQLFKNLQAKPYPLNPIPLLIALIFLIHPVQTEAVSYVSGFSDPLVALFGFLSLTFFLKTKKSWRTYLLSFITFSFALLSKEIGIIFAGIIFLLSCYFNIYKTRNFTRLFIQIMPFFLLVFTYLFYHTRVIDVADMKTVWGPHPYTDSIFVRIATFLSILPTYLGILLVPKDLFYERDFTITILTSPWNFISFSVVTCLVVLFMFIIFQKNKHAAVFFFLSFFIAFLPYTGVILINGIMYEHFLYLPMIFFFAFLIHIIPNLPKIRYLPLIACILFSVLILRSWIRQSEWQDPIRLYQQTLAYAPRSFRVLNNLGMTYQQRGDIQSAMAAYKKVIDISPTIPNAYHNIGNLYFEKADYKQAEQYFLKAIATDPFFGYSYAALVKVYQITEEKEKLQNITQAIQTKFSNSK